jgi:NAD(P)-dependent dehydrogenase (short-subunit alcohol dehydrogenase family)
MDITPEEFARVTDVTYLGYVHGTQAALRRMLPRDHGVIVQVGSALAFRGIPLQSAYCGAKHAVEGFTESLRCELLHDRSRVRVTEVHLPAVNTPQFGWVRTRLPRSPQPVPPIYQPEFAADAVYDAVRRPKRAIFLGWPTVVGTLASSIAPGVVERYLALTAYNSQQGHEPVPRGRRDNLWEVLPGDPGPHGAFDGQSKERDLTLWAAKHSLGRWLLLGVAAMAAFLWRRN